MNLRNINVIYKHILVDMFEVEFIDVVEFLTWTDMIIWNHLNINNKKLNSDKQLMNYYVMLIKKLMESELYLDTFKTVYKNEKSSDIISKLNEQEFNSFVFVIDKLKILSKLIKYTKK